MNIFVIRAELFFVLYLCLFFNFAFPADYHPVLQKTHTGNRMMKVEYSKNGEYLITTAPDNTVKIWRVNDGVLVRSTAGTSTNINDFELSSDKEYMAVSYGKDKLIRIDFNSGSVIDTLLTGKGADNITFSKRGDMIASNDFYMLNYLEVSTKRFDELDVNAKVNCIAFTPDEKHIITGSTDAHLKIWNIKNKELVFDKALPEDNWPVDCITTKDGRYLITKYASDEYIHIWEINSRKNVPVLKHFKKIKYKRMLGRLSCISDSGDLLLAQTYDPKSTVNEIVLISTSDWSVIKAIQIPPYDLCSDLSPDNEHIAVGFCENYIEIYNVGTGLLEKRIGERELDCSLVIPSYEGNYIFSVYKNVIRMWRLSDLSVHRTFIQPHSIEQVVLSKDDKYLIYSPEHSNDYDYGCLYVLNAESGAAECELTGFEGVINELLVTPDNNYLIAGTSQGDLKMYDMKDWKLISQTEKKVDGSIDQLGITSDKDFLIVSALSTKSERVNLYSLPYLTFVTDVYCPYTNYLATSPAENYYAAPSIDAGTIDLFRVPERSFYRQLKGAGTGVRRAVFSSDGSLFAAGEGDGTITIRETKGFNIIKILKGHSGGINSLQFFRDDGYLVSSSGDGLANIWNIKSGEHVSLASDDKDWIVFDSEGYFDCSGKGGSLLAMCKGLDACAVDQFAVEKNRPDILLNRIEINSANEKSFFYNRYLKRLRKLNISGAGKSGPSEIPVLNITGTRQEENILYSELSMNGGAAELISYNIYVNDVPEYGATGRKISGRTVTLKDSIELGSGKNKIEISCMNEFGIESYRSVLYAEINKRDKGNLYFIGFGVSQYQNSSLDLQFAHQDVLDLAELFMNMGSMFSNVYVKTYINEEVTVESIVKAKEMLKNAGVDDIFVLFIAGHGVHDTDPEATYYYITYNTDINDLKGTAADFELVEGLMQEIKPRKKFFLMDTCESGETDEETVTAFFDFAGSRGIKPRTTRALTIALKKGQEREKRDYVQESDRYILNDLLRRTGAIVFSSSKGGEFSYESDEYANGFFTEELIRGFQGYADFDKDGIVSSDELRRYVSNAVPELSGNKQHPTVDRDNIYQSISFPVLK